MARELSPLGIAIEEALSRRLAVHRDPVRYLACFRTPKGAVVGCERGTKHHVNLWVRNEEAVRLAAERAGMFVQLTAPWPDGRSGRYGRLSALRAVPEFCDEPLLAIQATTVAQALVIAEALF